MKRFNFPIVLNVIGATLLIESVAMMLCIIATIYYKENYKPIVYSSLITAGVGGFLFLLFRNAEKRINKQDGYLIISFIWIFISCLGALPFILSGYFPNSVDAFFESVSGFTTTGSSVIINVETISKDILLWRSITQWLGGLCFILLSLSLISVFRISGLQKFSLEMPESFKDKIQFKSKDIVKRILGIYSLFTLLQIIFLMIGKMSFFDSLNHSFSTISTGGFSTYNTSLSTVSPYIQYVFIIFMFIAGANFTLSLFAFQRKFNVIWKNEEFKAYIITIGINTFLISCILFFYTNINNTSFVHIENAIRTALFQVVSITSTTGFVSANFISWPWIAICLLLFIYIIGGSSGSASGGIKMIRLVILAKRGYLEFKRLLHPQAIIPLRIQQKPLEQNVITNVLIFTIVYILVFIFGVIIMTFLNNDFETSMGAVASSIGNIGPGFGVVGPLNNFSIISNESKWVLSFLMICGRLELFTILILFSPIFWRK